MLIYHGLAFKVIVEHRYSTADAGQAADRFGRAGLIGRIVARYVLFVPEGYDVSAVSSLRRALQYACNDANLDVPVTDCHLSEGETGTHLITALRVASKPVIAEELLTLLSELLAT